MSRDRVALRAHKRTVFLLSVHSRLKPASCAMMAAWTPGKAVHFDRWTKSSPVLCSGMLTVPPGPMVSYTFLLTSDDGSLLYIDGALVINNGGMPFCTGLI